MWEMNSLFWLSSVLIVTHNFGLSRGILEEKWIRQYQDHYDDYNYKTWLMRYYENDIFYLQSAPIFIMIGGEGEITPDDIGDTRFMYELARAYGAMLYCIEHRYYGKSHPVADTSFKNLRYLSIPQVLADIAYFIEFIKKELNNPNAFVMVFGGSYAGNLAAWMRVKYPNLVQAALADSAPVYLKINSTDYYDSVENTIRHYDDNCAMNIKEAFSVLGELLKNTTINRIRLINDFKLCDPDFSQRFGSSPLILGLLNIFTTTLMFNGVERNGKTSIENLCSFMEKNEIVSPYYRLAEIYKKKYLRSKPCISSQYNQIIKAYLGTSWESKAVAMRLWLYQCCAELGIHRMHLSPNSIFGSLIPHEYFADICRDVFTSNYNVDSLMINIRRINLAYNSHLSNTKNLIFTNGDLDPYRSCSVMSHLNADSPTFLINGASHCAFLMDDEASSTNSLIVTRCYASFMICDWLDTYKRLHENWY